MSVTIAIKGDAPMAKMLSKDLYPSLTDEDFAMYGGTKDENGNYFEMISLWPDINMTSGNFYNMMKYLTYPDTMPECVGSMEVDEAKKLLYRAECRQYISDSYLQRRIQEARIQEMRERNLFPSSCH